MDDKCASWGTLTIMSSPSALSTAPPIDIDPSPPTLTASRHPNTPATHKVFGTIELAEVILSELPFEDLLIAMGTCKSFCTIIKTSKAVMKDKVWLSLDVSEDASDSDDDDDNNRITHAPCFRRWLSFSSKTKNDSPNYSLEMIKVNDNSFEGKRSKLIIRYRYGRQRNQSTDTVIVVTADASDELWRRLPVTNASEGICVRVLRFDGEATEITLPRTTTLGDMWNSVSVELADWDPPRSPCFLCGVFPQSRETERCESCESR